MRHPLRFLFTFNGLLLTLTLATLLFVWGYPLARNLYAFYAWDRLPCWHAADGNHFYFDRQGITYYGDCHSFWDNLQLKASRATGAFKGHPMPDICYVSRGTPMEAVDALDSPRHLERAFPQFGVSAILIVACLILSYAARKSPKPRPPAPAPRTEAP